MGGCSIIGRWRRKGAICWVEQHCNLRSSATRTVIGWCRILQSKVEMKQDWKDFPSLKAAVIDLHWPKLTCTNLKWLALVFKWLALTYKMTCSNLQNDLHLKWTNCFLTSNYLEMTCTWLAHDVHMTCTWPAHDLHMTTKHKPLFAKLFNWKSWNWRRQQDNNNNNKHRN